MNHFPQYLLHLADTALIQSQRSAEWCGHGPVLEQDIAITNLSLDLLGQARYFYQYAATLLGDGQTEDSLAYLRTERQYKNLLITELPNGDWAQTVLRQFFLSSYQQLLFQSLRGTNDAELIAIASKTLKEVNYHTRWSSEWVIRLGDGTEESHQRLLTALENTWNYTGEFFQPADYELACASEHKGVDPSSLKDHWMEKVKQVFLEANISMPGATFMQTGGKQGKHTEHMGYILSELQYMQRTYPNAEW